MMRESVLYVGGEKLLNLYLIVLLLKGILSMAIDGSETVVSDGIITGNHTGQRDAIREIMRREARPLSVGEIVMFLGQSGWEWTSFDPTDSVKTSLKKSKDLVRIAHNRWILETYSYVQKVIRAARPKIGLNHGRYRWDLIDSDKVQASRDKATQDRKDRQEVLRASYNS